MLEALDARLHGGGFIRHLQQDCKRCKVRPTCYLEEGPYMLDALGSHVVGDPLVQVLCPRLDQLLRLADHALSLLIEELLLLCGVLRGLRVQSILCLQVLLQRDRVVDNAVVQALQILAGQVLVVVDAAIVRNKLSLGHFVFDTRIVQVRLQHDQGERQDEGAISVCELVRVVLAVLLGKLLHHAINLLRLARKSEEGQEAAQRGI
mmetsp:Transcript_93464/g.234799  ORF Transcript_93464/g.234799 Transcript_93464/m.234799 type:complete len:206 (+) Transcript_93464:3049-3666(+)